MKSLQYLVFSLCVRVAVLRQLVSQVCCLYLQRKLCTTQKMSSLRGSPGLRESHDPSTGLLVCQEVKQPHNTEPLYFSYLSA